MAQGRGSGTLSPAQRRLAAAAAAGACLTAWARISLRPDSFVFLLLSVRRDDGALTSHPLVSVGFHSAYAWGSRAAAEVLALLPGGAETLAAGLLLGLWLLSAWLFFRLVERVTASDAAAAFAAAAFGADLPLGYSDSPYTLTSLDRMLSVPPLFWGLRALIERRFWAAWLGLVASTYLHAHPAMYCWPWLFVEDALAAFKEPGRRRGFAARTAFALLAALPLLRSAGGNPFSELDPALAQMTVSLVSQWMTGTSIVPFDILFALEGYALVALSLWSARRRPDTTPWLRAVMLGLMMALVGTVTYTVQIPDSRLWGLLAKLQLGGALYLPELAGGILIALWLAETFAVDAPLGAALVLAHVVSSHFHDPILRGAVVFCGAAMACGRLRAARAMLAASAVLPLAYACLPGPFAALARAVGLRGGLFSLASFQPALAGALAAAAGAGALSKKRRVPPLAAAAALAAALLVVVRVRAAGGPPDPSLDAMAARLRELPARSVVLASPLDLVSCLGFMPRAGRQVLLCKESFLFALHFGPSAAPLGAVLREAGVDPEGVRGAAGLRAALARADAELDQGRLARLAAKRGVTHLLSLGPRPWLGVPLAAEGPYRLYAVP